MIEKFLISVSCIGYLIYLFLGKTKGRTDFELVKSLNPVRPMWEVLALVRLRTGGSAVDDHGPRNACHEARTLAPIQFALHQADALARGRCLVGVRLHGRFRRLHVGPLTKHVFCLLPTLRKEKNSVFIVSYTI